MSRLPLLGGAYSPRSVISNAQRCINLYPEAGAVGAPAPITCYQRPGLRPLANGPNAPVRGLFCASNETGYTVIGANVYSISNSWQLTLLGTLGTTASTPVSMTDNGTTLVLVDGSPQGYMVDLTTNAFSTIVDLTGTFQGADKVDYIDTFILWNMPGSVNFGSTLSNVITFDPLYFAGKTDYPDPLATLIVNRHNILLIGTKKSEIWYDAGNTTFPFAELPGAYFEHGTGAIYSVAASDISVFFLGQDLQGHGVVFRARGYACNIVSNRAIEFQIRKIANSVGISDAIGYTYQQDGHWFYVLHFPSGNQTWVFDDTLGEDPNIAWHQEAWTDADGGLNRHRGNCHAFINGQNVVGDWENGTLYAMDLDVYTDTVNGVAGPVSYIRTFPHIGTGEVEIGPFGKRPILADGRRVQFHDFMADIACGEAPVDAAGNPAMIGLRYSDDRGNTFSQLVYQTLGTPGQFQSWPTWRALGIARDRVFELQYSAAGPAALNGAWAGGTVLES